MKYLIYELFCGVGFCNQLFSLETSIYLANITNRKLFLLLPPDQPQGPRCLTPVEFLRDSPKELPESALLINATSLGLKSEDPAPVELSAFPRSIKVFDMIYNPPETALLAAAARKKPELINVLLSKGDREETPCPHPPPTSL